MLRISLTATRVAAEDTRVRYAYGHHALIPEDLVLRRWKDRSRTDAARARGDLFDGCRLHPQLWATLRACADAGLGLDAMLTAERLRVAMGQVKAGGLRTGPVRADKYVVLLNVLRARRLLRSVMSRERNPVSPGVPDLFLWRQQRDRPPVGVFVEVKRRYRNPHGRWVREPLLASQQEELAFLTGLKLGARTVYLREAPA